MEYGTEYGLYDTKRKHFICAGRGIDWTDFEKAQMICDIWNLEYNGRLEVKEFKYTIIKL